MGLYKMTRGVSLSIFAYEGVTGDAAGSPVWAGSGAIYLWGVLVYAAAYVALVRGGVGQVQEA